VDPSSDRQQNEMNSYVVATVTLLVLLRNSLHSNWHWPIMSKLVTITLRVTHRESNYRVQGAVIFATNVLKNVGFL
jgi:hypothetical protein